MPERTTDLQRRVLATLAERGPMSRDQVARHVDTTRAQAARALNTLAERLLVNYLPEPGRHAARRQTITDAGREHLADLVSRGEARG